MLRQQENGSFKTDNTIDSGVSTSLMTLIGMDNTCHMGCADVKGDRNNVV